VLSKNLQVICVGTRVNASFGGINRVPKSPAMGPLDTPLLKIAIFK
jgi:hypothetical protein